MHFKVIKVILFSYKMYVERIHYIPENSIKFSLITKLIKVNYSNKLGQLYRNLQNEQIKSFLFYFYYLKHKILTKLK